MLLLTPQNVNEELDRLSKSKFEPPKDEDPKKVEADRKAFEAQVKFDKECLPLKLAYQHLVSHGILERELTQSENDMVEKLGDLYFNVVPKELENAKKTPPARPIESKELPTEHSKSEHEAHSKK